MLDTVFYGPQGLFDQLNSLQQALSRTLTGDTQPDAIRSMGAGSFPGVNVGRTARTVEIYAFAPGLTADSIEVTVERGVLKLAGERHAPEQASNAKVQAYAAERQQGRFSRALSLPDDVDTSKVEAKYRDGILHVSIGLSQTAQPQRITVQ